MVPPTRLEGDPTATVLRGGASWRIPPDAAPHRRARRCAASTARDPLLSFEEFSAGNYTVGRGYDPGTLLGDSGIGLQAELRFGSAVPRRADEFRAEPYVFFDQAWVWNEDRVFVARPPGAELGRRRRARRLWRPLPARRCSLAVPLDRGPLQARKGDPRLLVSFTTRLWPWRSR